MQAGKLNKRVLIERQSANQDTVGQPVSTWTIVATVWASIKHQAGQEALKADAVASEVKVLIRTRYRTDITAAMRCVRGSTTYNVLAVLPDEARKEFLDLFCEVVQ